jgi:hypothetical protein
MLLSGIPINQLSKCLLVLLFPFTCVLVTGCASNISTVATPSPAPTISILPANASAAFGTVEQFQVVQTTGNVNVDVTASSIWQSSASGSFVSNGSFACGSAGTFSITASYQDLTAQAAIHCGPKPVLAPAPAPTFSILPLNTTTPYGATQQFHVVLATAGTSLDVTNSSAWQTSQPGTAVSDGSFTCTSSGTFSVIASYEGLTAQASISCQPKPAPPPTFSILPLNTTTPYGVTQQFHVVLTTAGTSLDVTNSSAWQTSQSGTVVPDGSFTCTSSGTFSVIASYEGLTAQASISCQPKPTPTVTALQFGLTPQMIRSELPFQYQLLANLSDGTKADVTSQATWTTDSDSATINSSALFDCNHAGSSTVTASYGGLTINTQTQCFMRSNPPPPGFLDTSSVFVGPFPSWTNVKQAFGAKGDGVADDTAAFLNAIATLNGPNTVLWLPRGTYLISSTLLLQSLQQIMIVGEDPLTTSVKWVGPANQTIFSLVGSTNVDIGRLTIDGAGTAGVGIDIDSGAEYYPTYNYMHDLRIINIAKGLVDGLAGELTVDRVHFANNTLAGLSLETGDAQNINVVDSLFTDCARGITNYYGGGSFYVSNSFFVRSTIADLSIGNTGPFSARNNVSINSNQFFLGVWNGAPSNIVLQGNTIVNPSSMPIFMDSEGPMTLIDNRFLQINPAMGLVWGNDSYNPLQLLSVGNRFTVTDPFHGPANGPLMNYTSIDEAPYTQDEDPIPDVPSEIYVPPLSTAPVFDIPAYSTDAVIRQVFAAAISAGHSVVHLSAALYKYNLDSTITIPPGTEITVVGDGPFSWLSASPQLQGPILDIQSDKALIQNMQIGAGENESDAVDIHLPDEPDSFVRCDECATLFHSNSSLELDGLDDAAVVVGVATLNSSNWAATVHGGTARQNGLATVGRVAAFGASTDAFQVDNGGHFLLEDGWHDGGQGSLQMVLTGTSVVADEGGTVYNEAPAGLQFKGFNGEYTLAGVATDTNLLSDAASTPTVLLAGVVQVSGLNPVISQGPSSSISLIETFGTSNNADPYATFSGAPITEAEIEHRLRLIRSQYRTPLPAQLSGVRIGLNRVRTISSPIGIHVEPSGPLSNARYHIAPASPLAQPTACALTSQIAASVWSLVDGGDEAFGLTSGGLFLVEDYTSDGTKTPVAAAPMMASARARWMIVPNGDGSDSLTNRATGDRMTLEADGCPYAEPYSGAPNQSWLFRNTN